MSFEQEPEKAQPSRQRAAGFFTASQLFSRIHANQVRHVTAPDAANRRVWQHPHRFGRRPAAVMVWSRLVTSGNSLTLTGFCVVWLMLVHVANLFST